MEVLVMLVTLIFAAGLSFILLPATLRFVGNLAGQYLRRTSRARRALLLTRVAQEQEVFRNTSSRKTKSTEDDWEEIESSNLGTTSNGAAAEAPFDGIVGFFHPFCNAGGGGERVLWAAIRATQKTWPDAVCVVYTGDHDVDKDAIIERVKERFNISLHSPTVHFLYLTKRHYVLSSTWPHFTLLGQSLGSMILAYDAFRLLVPDVLVDTMGYAFALSFSSWLFPSVPTGAYVHYPTISTDMLASLGQDGQGVNAGAGAGFRGSLKRVYWRVFAHLYSRVGGAIDVVMTNSSWTQSHIMSLWGPFRPSWSGDSSQCDVDVVFPPVAVEEVEKAVAVSEASEDLRRRTLLYIAQFRPEKNHQLILASFAAFWHEQHRRVPSEESSKLVLVGSVRDSDDATRVYNLRLLAHELGVKDHVDFECDATWAQMLDLMRCSSVGVNGMWNEHFGIGVVEYQAAGLISVVNDSGGPKHDIVVDMDGGPTGFHATTEEQYAAAFQEALSLSREETLAMRRRARASAKRFTDGVFEEKWIKNMRRLLRIQSARAKR